MFDVSSVYNETIILHPNYHLEPFGKFGGYANSHAILPSLLTVSLGGTCLYAPFFGYYCRSIALKELDSTRSSLSEKSLLQVGTFINGLTVQVILPVICYVPVSITWMYDKYSGEDPIVISQYFIATLLVLPSVCDPLLTVYFIVPYRNAVKNIVQHRTPSSSQTENDVQPTKMFQKSEARSNANGQSSRKIGSINCSRFIW